MGLPLAYCYVIARPRCPMFVARCLLGSILDRLGYLFIFGEVSRVFFFNAIQFNSNLDELYVVAYSGVCMKSRRPVHRYGARLDGT